MTGLEIAIVVIGLLFGIVEVAIVFIIKSERADRIALDAKVEKLRGENKLDRKELHDKIDQNKTEILDAIGDLAEKFHKTELQMAEDRGSFQKKGECLLAHHLAGQPGAGG